MKLEANEIEILTNVDHNPNEITSNKRKNTNYSDYAGEWREIVFPSFDSNKKIGSFGNDDKMISTVVYVASCHPDNSELLYILSSRVFSIEQESIKQDTRHFMPYGLV